MEINEDKGPFSFGETIIKHKGVYISTILNNPDFEKLLKNIENKEFDYEVRYIPEEFAHRPDNISELFYDSPKYWWLLMLVNNIHDPFEGFYTNQRILIPIL